MLAAGAGGEVAAEIGVAPLPVPVLSVALWSQGDADGGEGSQWEEGGKRQHSLFLWGKVVRADQWRAPAALSSRVVGAGGVFIVRALRELVDGRQLTVVRVVLFIIVQACESVVRCQKAILSTRAAASHCFSDRGFCHLNRI